MRPAFLLFSDVRATELMQHFDVFEHSKVVVQAATANVVDDFGTAEVEELRRRSVGEPYELVAISVPGHFQWSDPYVKTVSDGRVWIPLADWLQKVGLQTAFGRAS